MKKNLQTTTCILTVFMLFFPFVASAQQVLPMLKEGRTWNMSQMFYVYDGLNSEKSPLRYEYSLNGDTIIDGIVWKKLVWSGEYPVRKGDLTYKEIRSGEFSIALREEAGKIYAWWDMEQAEVLIYDFCLSVDDVYQCHHGFLKELTVVSVDTVKTGDTLRRRWRLNDNDPMLSLIDRYWVEGIGAPYGPGMFYPFSLLGYPEQVESVYDGDVCIFTKEDFTAPAYSEATSVISFGATHSTSPLYDLYGRRVTGMPRRGGVYVQDGRKVVVK